MNSSKSTLILETQVVGATMVALCSLALIIAVAFGIQDYINWKKVN